MKRRFKSEPNPILEPFTDIRNAKRVKFNDSGLYPSAAKRRTIHSPKSTDVPKTSEYAYFKNVKNRNVNTSEAHYLNTDVRKPENKDFEYSVSEERIRRSDNHTLVSPRVKLTFSANQRSPLPSQHATPREKHLPPVPFRDVSDIPDSTCNTKQQSSFLSQNLTPVRGRQHFPSSPVNEAVDISFTGNQCSKKGIFSEKRQRLLQWAVRTSSPDVQNIHPNGYDLVASLLNRLFPKSDESYGSLTERSDNSKSLLVHESKDFEKEPKVPHTRNQDEHLPIIRYGNTNEIVPSEWNFSETRFSSHKSGSGNLIEYDILDSDRLNSRESNSHKKLQFYHLEELCSPVEYAREEPHNRFLLDWDPKRQKTGVYSSIVNCNAASLATSWHDDYQKMEICSPVEYAREEPRNRSLLDWVPERQKTGVYSSIVNCNAASLATSWHDDYQKMEICSPVEYAREEPRNRSLLDWDPKRQKNEAYLSIVNPNAANLATSWHDDYQKMMENEFGTKALCSSLEFNSVPNYESPSSLIQDFEPGLEHVKYSVAEHDQFALTFPYNSKGVGLEDYRNAENTVFSIDNMISYRDDHRFNIKAWDGKVRNDSYQKSSYASTISEEDVPSICRTWQFPRAEQYPFSGNSFDHYFLSSNYNERYSLTNQTSLLSNFRKDRFEIDFYPDDDHKLEYGQVL